jgi:hypothetical protein
MANLQSSDRPDFNADELLNFRPMNTPKNKTQKIYLRLTNGWSEPVENGSEERCDVDGALLWIGPGGQIYCNLIHDPDKTAAETHSSSGK